MAASLPFGDQLLTPSPPRVPTQQWRDTGAQVSVGVAYCWGTSAYPKSAPGYTPRQHPRCRGSMRLRGKPSPSGLRGDCLHHRVHLHSEGVQQLYLSSRHARPFAWSITPSRAPFHPPVCVLWSHQTPHKTHVARENRHRTNL
ncbi:hypothetical protein GWK47_044339 [Chionoecetes opilio]|uniref:Uncharacterized protein n=1 Tax=Chionoecetes opilio TaxID=41210 RepID=A0A8J5CVC9_CHIOP|nr:hypothetical protein GWK47_044339 [Chionoecetes opilio]